MQESLLLIEDDLALAALTAEYLRAEGYQVTVAHRGDGVAALVRALQPALIVLDIMLPGMDGYAVCRQIRAEYAGLILMLTALDESADQLTGFAAGADDFVVKPVDPPVLLARLRAMLRRRPAWRAALLHRRIRPAVHLRAPRGGAVGARSAAAKPARPRVRRP